MSIAKSNPVTGEGIAKASLNRAITQHHTNSRMMHTNPRIIIYDLWIRVNISGFVCVEHAVLVRPEAR